ncbi:MAG TPA: aminopeptidase [Thermoplasmata archaeon]|jgi:leucyl aminopeptidase (aminopeptidase T)|nr:aminopeptidase [Thermoplasmata archaeon]
MAASSPAAFPFEEWIPLARQVVRTSFRLQWKDVLEVYTFPRTIPLAEALALEARRAGSDTHLTLMTDDLWFTSMRELSTKWLSTPSPVEESIGEAITAHVYLGGPGDARRLRDIPAEKFEANSTGGTRQDEPRRRRRVRGIDFPIGRVTPERAESYGLDYARWYRSYHAALAVDLAEIQRRGVALARKLAGKKVRVTSPAGTDLRFTVKRIPPVVDDGIISPADAKRGFVEASLPAGSLAAAVRPESVEGVVRAQDPVFFAGRTIASPWYRIKKGRIAEWGAAQNADLLDRDLKMSGVAKARIGYVTVGLNPKADTGMLDNSIVENNVGIGLGAHPALERKAFDPNVFFVATMGRSHIEVTK